MRRVLLLLLTTALLANLVGVPTQAAGPKASSVTVRLAPARVTLYEGGMREPTGVVATVSPAMGGRSVTFQRAAGSSWTTIATTTTDSSGRAWHPLSITETGKTTYRAVVAGNARFRGDTSPSAALTAYPNTGCRPVPAAVDGSATGEATCLLARLDRWRSNGLMGVGQQLNVSSKELWDQPLAGIAAPAVIGFDLEELDQAATAEFPYADENIGGLLERARSGAVLVASWHAKNPFVPGEDFTSKRQDLSPLLSDDPTQHDEPYDRFWADWEAKLDLLERFEIGDADGDGLGDGPDFNEYRTAVVVRPLHEVNGGFFWWGKPNPTEYKQLFSMLQDKAAERGVNNLLWAYSGNRDTSSTTDPSLYLPYRLDVGGLDSYDPELGAANAKDAVGLEGYSRIAGALRSRPAPLPRMALTEVGPHGSADGSWNPAVISRTVRTAGVAPLWAMLWFDDGSGRDGITGKKQLSSLDGGRAWLRSCYNSLCYLR